MHKIKLAFLSAPYEAGIGWAALISGIPLLLGHLPPTIQRTLPPYLQIAWAVETTVAGVLLLLGLVTFRRSMQQFALVVVCATGLAYGSVILASSGVDGIYVATCQFCIFGLGSAVRLYAMRAADRVRQRVGHVPD